MERLAELTGNGVDKDDSICRGDLRVVERGFSWLETRQPPEGRLGRL